jgi:hypothetical protein
MWDKMVQSSETSKYRAEASKDRSFEAYTPASRIDNLLPYNHTSVEDHADSAEIYHLYKRPWLSKLLWRPMQLRSEVSAHEHAAWLAQMPWVKRKWHQATSNVFFLRVLKIFTLLMALETVAGAFTDEPTGQHALYQFNNIHRRFSNANIRFWAGSAEGRVTGKASEYIPSTDQWLLNEVILLFLSDQAVAAASPDGTHATAPFMQQETRTVGDQGAWGRVSWSRAMAWESHLFSADQLEGSAADNELHPIPAHPSGASVNFPESFYNSTGGFPSFRDLSMFSEPEDVALHALALEEDDAHLWVSQEQKPKLKAETVYLLARSRQRVLDRLVDFLSTKDLAVKSMLHQDVANVYLEPISKICMRAIEQGDGSIAKSYHRLLTLLLHSEALRFNKTTGEPLRTALHSRGRSVGKKSTKEREKGKTREQREAELKQTVTVGSSGVTFRFRSMHDKLADPNATEMEVLRPYVMSRTPASDENVLGDLGAFCTSQGAGAAGLTRDEITRQLLRAQDVALSSAGILDLFRGWRSRILTDSCKSLWQLQRKGVDVLPFIDANGPMRSVFERYATVYNDSDARTAVEGQGGVSVADRGPMWLAPGELGYWADLVQDQMGVYVSPPSQGEDTGAAVSSRGSDKEGLGRRGPREGRTSFYRHWAECAGWEVAGQGLLSGLTLTAMHSLSLLKASEGAYLGSSMVLFRRNMRSLAVLLLTAALYREFLQGRWRTDEPYCFKGTPRGMLMGARVEVEFEGGTDWRPSLDERKGVLGFLANEYDKSKNRERAIVRWERGGAPYVQEEVLSPFMHLLQAGVPVSVAYWLLWRVAPLGLAPFVAYGSALGLRNLYTTGLFISPDES